MKFNEIKYSIISFHLDVYNITKVFSFNKMQKGCMRSLSHSFLSNLKDGILCPITEAVRNDKDLNLEIRENYINIYYKGHSLLMLRESSIGRYLWKIHEKFLENISIPEFDNYTAVQAFVSLIPALKSNILKYGISLEIEYEQLIIRANNNEIRNNSDYFIIDRQYAVPEGRFDLTGMCWKTQGRKKHQTVDPCLMEVKFALNDDLCDVHNQLSKYYYSIKSNAEFIAGELEMIFRQKLELGLYKQSSDRLEAMKTLIFSREIERFQFILLLVDYNPKSKKFDIGELRNLPFSNQVRVFNIGFALWDINQCFMKDTI